MTPWAAAAPLHVASLPAPPGASIACFAAGGPGGSALLVGGGPRAGASWRYSGLQADDAFQERRPPSSRPAAAAKPKRQQRDRHEKATKSKVKYGSRR